MAAEDWIDLIARAFEVSDGNGGKIKSFRQAEFPEALHEFPCVISYVTSYTPQYSLGGPLKGLYKGRSEFHLTSSVAKAMIPYVSRFYARIRNAAAAHMTLWGTVDHFFLDDTGEGSIVGPAELQYGNDDRHLGLVVVWQVKADEAGEAGYTPAQ